MLSHQELTKNRPISPVSHLKPILLVGLPYFAGAVRYRRHRDSINVKDGSGQYIRSVLIGTGDQ